ncbi:MAG: competence protein ComEA [Gammaproteobacteria bacterium HGW-Gammaproteobacteria-1]|jgi:competence protein ComEA|nr:MAG: competence protein ComEA [Gammaproteobacteria bacterium HGW-Gammaproteobacteria-1]
MHKSVVAIFAIFLLALSAFTHAAPVDINTADAATLAQAIKGVGAKRADAIVAYRKEHGPFKSVDELAKVPGIGAKVVEENRQNIAVGKQ